MNWYKLCYNKSMKREYKVSKTTTSLIKYHFVFCSKYRRKIFLIPGVEQRMKELTKEQCEKEQIEILEMKCDVDHVYLYVRVYPQTTISRIMGSIRDCTSKILVCWTIKDECSLDKTISGKHRTIYQRRNDPVVCRTTEKTRVILEADYE